MLKKTFFFLTITKSLCFMSAWTHGFIWVNPTFLFLQCRWFSCTTPVQAGVEMLRIKKSFQSKTSNRITATFITSLTNGDLIASLLSPFKKLHFKIKSFTRTCSSYSMTQFHRVHPCKSKIAFRIKELGKKSKIFN